MNAPWPAQGRLALVLSHPIQYVAPWLAYLHTHLRGEIQVFYLHRPEDSRGYDPGFAREIAWDVDLRAGYPHEFVPNCALDPGTHRFRGLDNPQLGARLAAFRPAAILLLGYNFRSHLRLLSSPRFARTPFLFRGDSHELVGAAGWSDWRSRARHHLLPWIFRRFAAFLPVGRANAAYFARHGVAPHRLFPTPHTVDLARFCPPGPTVLQEAQAWRARLGIPPHHRVILFAGKFELKKRPDLAIAAFRRARLPGTTLLLVGSGALEPELRRQAGDDPAIRFAPFQNQSEMPRTYAAADLFVLPSEGRGETWGLAVQEAMSLGRPAIVSAHVGCHPDLLERRETGLIVTPGDAAALAQAFQMALADPLRLARWGKNAARLARRLDHGRATLGLQRALDFVAS